MREGGGVAPMPQPPLRIPDRADLPFALAMDRLWRETTKGPWALRQAGVAEAVLDGDGTPLLARRWGRVAPDAYGWVEAGAWTSEDAAFIAAAHGAVPLLLRDLLRLRLVLALRRRLAQAGFPSIAGVQDPIR